MAIGGANEATATTLFASSCSRLIKGYLNIRRGNAAWLAFTVQLMFAEFWINHTRRAAPLNLDRSLQKENRIPRNADPLTPVDAP